MDRALPKPVDSTVRRDADVQNLASAAQWVFGRHAARAVDHAAIHEFCIPGMVLMENAARALATSAQEMIGDASSASTLIVCGSGNNGGDGYALARHLHNAGIDVTILAIGEPASKTDAAVNRAICERMGFSFIAPEQLEKWSAAHDPDLIVDAIFGTGLDRPVSGVAEQIINWINAADCQVLAADIPSGMDCDTGEVLGCCVRATRTVTFVGVKRGFLNPQAQKLLGEVVVGDIGAPVELIRRFGTSAHIPVP